MMEAYMKYKLAVLAVLATAASPVFAVGDAVKGEAGFKQCQTCHAVIDDAGVVLAGKGKIGPNLYGLFGRQIGSLEGFKYGESIVAVGATGLVWEETNFIAYVQDPAAYLKEALADKGAKSKMAFKVKTPELAADLYAYLAQFSPAPAAAADGTAPAADGAATTTP